MGTFILESTKVHQKEKSSFIEYTDILDFSIVTKEFNTESVKVELSFVNNGDTSEFTEADIMIIIMEKLKELRK